MAQRFLDSAAQLSQDIRRSTDGLTSIDYVEDVAVTHYGDAFNGQTLGCGGGTYSSDNGGIVAVGPERNQEWPCGTVLRICGPGGCMIGERVDSCPGCDGYHVDLSEEGLYLVCGPGTGVCRASVEVFTQTRVETFIPACEFTQRRADQRGQGCRRWRGYEAVRDTGGSGAGGPDGQAAGPRAG